MGHLGKTPLQCQEAGLHRQGMARQLKTKADPEFRKGSETVNWVGRGPNAKEGGTALKLFGGSVGH